MILAKFIAGLWDDTVITQEEIQSEIKITQDLENFGFSTFSMPIIEGIEEDVIVELYNIRNTDTLIFRGFIHEINPIRQQFREMNITLRTEKAVFYRRQVLSDKSYTGQTISHIVNDLITDSHYGTYENWTFNITGDITVPELELKIGDNYFDIFNELAELIDAYWTVENGVITMSPNIGQDKTSGFDYQEVVFDGSSPSTSNISLIDLVGEAKRANIATAIGKDGIKHTEVDFSDGKLYGATSEYVREGSLVEKAQRLLSKRNRPQRTYSVDVEQNTLDANIGDSIRLFVQNTNSFFDIDSSVVVSKKNIQIDNGAFNITYELQAFETTPTTFDSFLKEIKKNIKLLEI